MDLLFNYENVHIDLHSDDDLNTIVEREYLKELFYQLEQRLDKRFAEFEFYILFSHNPSVIPSSVSSKNQNKILFWFSDETGLFPDHLVNNYLVIFKSYVQKEASNVYSNPLGYVNEFIDHQNKKTDKKDVDIFFSGSLNENRKKLYELLFFRKFRFLNFLKILPSKILLKLFRNLKIRDLSYKSNILIFTGGFKSGLVYEDYFTYLLRSKFILCPKGNESSETFRHIEALHVGGIVISEKMPEVPFYKDNPFIVYNNYYELNQILRKIKKNEFDLPLLLKNHKMFYDNNLKTDAITYRISEILKQYLLKDYL